LKSPHHKIDKSSSINEKGQTLIVAVLAIIVLFLAALFLFDLQSIIRVKVKTQTAADAAALAGAKAQVQSLNLIGEINIIKACTVLVADFASGDAEEQLQAASANLTEMQCRITFVGPLLGI
jgi:Flp pilus assembly protein TadG